MKKTISTILSVSLLASMICIPVSATEVIVVSESIEEFCEDVNEMVTEYSDSEFVTPEFIEEEQIAENTDEEIEINYWPRLIVQSDKPIDTYNAVDVVSGFSNFHIVQFENENDTNSAYEKYLNDENIVSVDYDISYAALLETTEEKIAERSELTYKDYKNGWYLEATGMDMVLEKYKNQNLPPIVIAVIDTGVDLNCIYLQDRIDKTGINNTTDGDLDSEQDYYGHGTMVSSVIANCTTSNVKIANYRAINNAGHIESTTFLCATMIEAVDRGADVINCSFIYYENYKLIQEVIDYVYSKNCIIIAGAGNKLGNIEIGGASPLNTSKKTISVGASNMFNSPSSFTAFGKPVDILAPGEDMPLIDIGDEIVLVDGTSFSTPFIASVYSMFHAIFQTMSFDDKVRVIKSCGSGTDENFVTNLFGSGIVNVLNLFELNTLKEPTFSLKDGKYIGTVSLELFSEDDTDIYYTTDCTFPSPTNGFLYTQPIEFEDEYLCIRAVAYKNGNRSNYVSEDICSTVLGTDDMFKINDDGVITGYSGNVKYLKIPEIINGITVTDIAYSSGFNKAEIHGVILPDTIKYLGVTLEEYERVLSNSTEQIGPFHNNSTLEFIVGRNVKVIGSYGVSFNENLTEVEFPECENIMMRAFYECGLLGANFPKVKTVGRRAFWKATYMREIYLPECTEIAYEAFDTAADLSIIYAPKANFLDYKEFEKNVTYTAKDSITTQSLFSNCHELTSIDLPALQTIGSNAFFRTSLNRIEFSALEYLYDLPNTLSEHDINSNFYGSYYCEYYYPICVELSLPSTLQYCISATDYKNEFIEYVVYGTASEENYAKQWAEENGIKFINLSQETAIVADIEPIWDKYSYEPLEFDARGFNRTYQWYGSKDKIQGNYDDKPITNATDKTFNPDNYKSYPYYYCIMTSTDKDVQGKITSQVEIKSSMCQNRLYYMVSLPNTHIDFDNYLIYTQTTGCKSFFNIIEIQENTSYSSLPSLVYKEYYWYGTGSEFVIYNGTKKERYTLIVEGDVDGDSAVDVLDAYQVSLVVNGHTELTDEYFLAADTNSDQEITVEDYAQVVNLVLAS